MNSKIQNNIERILVSMDISHDGASFLEPLVALASRLNAELCGLFSEDSELQQIANLPFSREIIYPTATSRELNSLQIARHLKQHSETLRTMLQELSHLSNVACTFKTGKGSRIESMLGEAYDFQLVVFLPDKYTTLNPAARRTLEDVINPTVLLYDSSVQAQKSAMIARSLVDKGELHQMLVLTMDDASKRRIKKQLDTAEVDVVYKHIENFDISNILSLINTRNAGLLILPLEARLVEQSEALRRLLTMIKCPLLLVR